MEQMCIWHARAQKQTLHAESIEEHKITKCCIGSMKGRKYTLYTDPYLGGERGSKHAKSDVLSPIANDSAHASQARMASGLTFSLSPTQIMPMHAPVSLATQLMP